MTKDCTKHDTPQKRQQLETIMNGILENQGGAGRHKCAYCAYERGFEEGIRHAAARLKDMLLKESKLTIS